MLACEMEWMQEVAAAVAVTALEYGINGAPLEVIKISIKFIISFSFWLRCGHHYRYRFRFHSICRPNLYYYHRNAISSCCCLLQPSAQIQTQFRPSAVALIIRHNNVSQNTSQIACIAFALTSLFLANLRAGSASIGQTKDFWNALPR